MSANDQDDFIRREIDWIGVPLREDKPFLGICLGAQMLARQLGGKVFRHPRRPRRDRLLSDPADHAPASPSSIRGRNASINGTAKASICRRAPSFSPKAILSRCRRSAPGAAFALQFHPDVTHAMMHKWTTRGHDRMALPGAKPRHTHFADRAVYDYSARAWLSVFLERWLAAA